MTTPPSPLSPSAADRERDTIDNGRGRPIIRTQAEAVVELEVPIHHIQWMENLGSSRLTDCVSASRKRLSDGE